MRKLSNKALLILAVLLVLALGLASLCLLAVDKEPVYSYKIVGTFPHDPKAFTQGLVVADGVFYEGTGLYGESSLRKVSLEDGAVLVHVPLAEYFFGEGITILHDRIYQLTWLEQRGFVYDAETFEQLAYFTYKTEGWGLTTDGQSLIMSDGSSRLTFLNPDSFEPTRKLDVVGRSGAVTRLNELEYVNGELWANIWFSERIVRINPENGQVLGWIDLAELVALEREVNPGLDVLNGIAYDQAKDRLFVTGKFWSSIYEIELVKILRTRCKNVFGDRYWNKWL